ncbi:glycosyltransferase [Parerythrobacter aurantius]|uniref:glycosyltransferase n=1 Tax=Parerythrobacter aurantius TaxID=3127706 RepID=UPI003245EE16
MKGDGQPSGPARADAAAHLTTGAGSSKGVENPLVSIVTVTFNDLEALRETIKSVRCQDFPDMELLVIDGASRDGTREFLEALDMPKLRWISEPDGGIYDAMNKGLRLARGEYVYFLNAGDSLLEPTSMSRIAELLIERPALLMNKVRVMKDSAFATYPTTDHAANARSAFQSAYCHQAAVAQRAAYLAAGGFDLSYPHFADFKALWTIRSAHPDRYRQTTLEIADFDLNGVSSDWRHSVKLAAERERLLRELGEGSSFIAHSLRLLHAWLYMVRMSIRQRLT